MNTEIAGVAIEGHGLDDETVEHINRLRQWRLSLVRQQLMKVDETGAELINRGLISLQEYEHDDLKLALQCKIDSIADRLKKPTTIYSDEIDFFLNVAEESED